MPDRPLLVTGDPLLLDDLLRLCGVGRRRGPGRAGRRSRPGRPGPRAPLVLLGVDAVPQLVRVRPARAGPVSCSCRGPVPSERAAWDAAARVGAEAVQPAAAGRGPGRRPARGVPATGRWRGPSPSYGGARRCGGLDARGRPGGLRRPRRPGSARDARRRSTRSAVASTCCWVPRTGPGCGGRTLAGTPRSGRTRRSARRPARRSPEPRCCRGTAAIVAAAAGRGRGVGARRGSARPRPGGRSTYRASRTRRADAALATVDAVLLVVPAEVRSAAAAARVAGRLAGRVADVRVVVRGPSTGRLPAGPVARAARPAARWPGRRRSRAGGRPRARRSAGAVGAGRWPSSAGRCSSTWSAISDARRDSRRRRAGDPGRPRGSRSPVRQPTTTAVTAALRQEGAVLGSPGTAGAGRGGAFRADRLRPARAAARRRPRSATSSSTDRPRSGSTAVPGWPARPCRFRDEAAVRRLAQRLAASAGRRLDVARPTVDARLAGGVRLHAVLPPVSPAGTLLSLRVLRRRAFTLAELVDRGTLAACSRRAARARRPVPGRRSSSPAAPARARPRCCRACSRWCRPEERIVLVEDSGELAPAHPHVVRLEARTANVEGAGAVDLRTLVREALRMRPDRHRRRRGPRRRGGRAARGAQHRPRRRRGHGARLRRGCAAGPARGARPGGRAATGGAAQPARGRPCRSWCTWPAGRTGHAWSEPSAA